MFSWRSRKPQEVANSCLRDLSGQRSGKTKREATVPKTRLRSELDLPLHAIGIAALDESANSYSLISNGTRRKLP